MDNSQPHSGDLAYGHLQRDPGVTNVSSLNQALGTHLTPTLSARPAFHDAAFRLTDSPPTMLDPPRPAQPGPGPSRSPIEYGLHPDPPSHKRKQPDPVPNGQLGKRRRDEDPPDLDPDLVRGSKHWTDDEKTKLFTWLMDPSEDDHWNALRSTKNSCFRECAAQAFAGKKTYQALKGCYERNFNLFRQVHDFEAQCAANGSAPLGMAAEGDRLREYERRLQLARKAGCDVGTLNARTVDHWHRSGWYTLFYRRWRDDPSLTRLATTRLPNGASVAPDVTEVEDDANSSDLPDPLPPQSARTPPYSQPVTARPSVGPDRLIMEAGPSSSPRRPTLPAQKPPTPPPEPSHMHFSVPQTVMTACLQLLQAQAQHSKLKTDYLRRRDEREEKESVARQDLERRRFEREQAEREHSKEAGIKQRAQLAMELMNNPMVDASVRQAAVEYLKKLFATD